MTIEKRISLHEQHIFFVNQAAFQNNLYLYRVKLFIVINRKQQTDAKKSRFFSLLSWFAGFSG